MRTAMWLSTLSLMACTPEPEAVLSEVGPSLVDGDDFSLADVNSTSPTFDQQVQFSAQTTATAWYFGHST